MNPLNKSLHRRELEKYLKSLLPNLKGRICDIGSKNRRYDHFLSSRPIAVDIIPNKEKDILEGDIQNLSFGDNSFDSAICLEVIEYTSSPQKSIQEIHRILDKNGKAVVSVPFMMRTHEDRGRYTKEYLQELFAIFNSVLIIPIGNFYTIILDILRGKIIDQSFFIRIFLGIIWLPLLVFLPLSKISKDKRYVSGYIIIAQK